MFKSRKCGSLRFGIWFFVLGFCFVFRTSDFGFAAAAEDVVPAALPPRLVVATLDGEPVYSSEAQHEFNLAYRGRKLADAEKQVLLAAALEQVIDRRLVLRNLTKTGLAASDADVTLALTQLEKQLQAQEIPLAKHCQEIGLTVDDLRGVLRWRLTWQKYLARYATDENLQKYFDKNRPHFDGTQLKIAHILLKAPGDKAEEIRTAIAAGKLSFEGAAKQHSLAPTSKTGGDIGWIERHQPMPEEFAKAAYDLKPGEVSPPVTTAAGVHLIQVLEVKPGTLSWQDAAAELRPAVALYLFRWLADKERMRAKIERVGKWP